jgi:hypothetical protein
MKVDNELGKGLNFARQRDQELKDIDSDRCHAMLDPEFKPPERRTLSPDEVRAEFHALRPLSKSAAIQALIKTNRRTLMMLAFTLATREGLNVVNGVKERGAPQSVANRIFHDAKAAYKKAEADPAFLDGFRARISQLDELEAGKLFRMLQRHRAVAPLAAIVAKTHDLETRWGSPAHLLAGA